MKLFLNLKRQFASIVNDKEDSKDTNDSLIEIGLIVKKKREEMLLNMVAEPICREKTVFRRATTL